MSGSGYATLGVQESFSPTTTSITVPTSNPTDFTSSSPTGNYSGIGLSGKIGSSSNSGHGTSQVQQTSSGEQERENTLDEPVTETIMRDLRNIWIKTRQVIFPTPNPDKRILRDWDWWGPLVFCLLLSVQLTGAANASNDAVFATTFCIVWLGSLIITLNCQLLGGKLSLFQSVCVLGYCIFPLAVASLISFLIPLRSVKFLVIFIAYGWSTFSALTFLNDSSMDGKKALVLYPIFLFYLSLASLVSFLVF